MNAQPQFAYPLTQTQPPTIIINNYITNQYNNTTFPVPRMSPPPRTPERPAREPVAPGAPLRSESAREMDDSDSEDELQPRVLVFPHVTVRQTRMDMEMDSRMDLDEDCGLQWVEDANELGGGHYQSRDDEQSDRFRHVTTFRGSAPADDSDSEIDGNSESESDNEDAATVLDPDAMDIDDDDATVSLF